MKRMFLFALIVFMSFSLVGCAVFETRDVKKLKRQVTVLEARQDAIEKHLDMEPADAIYPPQEEDTAATAEEVEAMTKKDIQRALSNAGYYDGPIDGKIGTKSRKAIREFQEDKKLKVDGIAGTETKKALAEYLVR
ncbi:peptidoglycan-binding protein [Candidatus Omnitrophota bacterium]